MIRLLQICIYIQKEEVQNIIELIKSFQHEIIKLAEEHVDTIMPGYTHLQRAQPISFAHHVMTYFWMLERDKGRFNDSLKRIDISPRRCCFKWYNSPNR